jgi:aarF domain-containing kinase
LPREFGLLVKQSLYFDRYLKILAPNVDVMNDSRVMLSGQQQDGPKDKINGEAVIVDV